MTKVPDIIELFGAGRAPRPTNPRLRSGTGEVVNMPTVPPHISRDPWFDGVSTAAAKSEGPLYIWASTPSGKKVRLDGPFENEQQASNAFYALQKKAKPGSGMQLSIGPGAE